MNTMLTHNQVETIFSHLKNNEGERFFAFVDENVKWTVMGTHPLAGIYQTKKDFYEHTFARLNKILQQGVILEVNNIIVENDMAVVEMSSLSVANNGKPFNNKYCWIVRFKNDKIVEVRAYLDSELVLETITDNEK